MKKEMIAFLGTVGAAGANLLTDNAAEQYVVCANNAANPVANLVPPIPFGKIVNVAYIASQSEVTKVVLINTSATLFETIVPNQRYKVLIVEHMGDVNSDRPKSSVHAYTSPPVLSGNAITDRLNVYTALINKINNNVGNNVLASRTIMVPFTAGSDGAGTELNFAVGETVTQATSGVTGKVAKCEITSGTMAANNATGYLWIYDISNYTTLDVATNRNWTGTTTTVVVTGTAVDIKTVAGITIQDDANYFISDKYRGGATFIGLEGFESDLASVTREPVYSDGIGTVMASLYPVYSREKTDIIAGDARYESVYGVPEAGKTYTKCILTVLGGDKEELAGADRNITYKYVVYADESNATNLTNFRNALNAMS